MAAFISTFQPSAAIWAAFRSGVAELFWPSTMAAAAVKKAPGPPAFSSWPNLVLENPLLGSSSCATAPRYSEWSVTAVKSSGQARRAGTSPVAARPCSLATCTAGTITVSPRAKR